MRLRGGIACPFFAKHRATTSSLLPPFATGTMRIIPVGSAIIPLIVCEEATPNLQEVSGALIYSSTPNSPCRKVAVHHERMLLLPLSGGAGIVDDATAQLGLHPVIVVYLCTCFLKGQRVSTSLCSLYLLLCMTTWG